MAEICSYGCGKEARFFFKSGKGCCETSVNRCEGKRLRDSLKKAGSFKGVPAWKQEGYVHKGWSKGLTKNDHISLKTRSELLRFRDENVFIKDSTYARGLIKKRILEQKLIPYSCQICENDGHWMGKPMVLILDHINGVNNDNRLENLRFVCSNCDSQLDTYKSKNRRESELVRTLT